jgi:uncharacterized coiled-coil DUF342 family protein
MLTKARTKETDIKNQLRDHLAAGRPTAQRSIAAWEKKRDKLEAQLKVVRAEVADLSKLI